MYNESHIWSAQLKKVSQLEASITYIMFALSINRPRAPIAPLNNQPTHYLLNNKLSSNNHLNIH